MEKAIVGKNGNEGLVETSYLKKFRKEIVDQSEITAILHGDAQFQIIRAGIELGIFELLNEVGSLDITGIVYTFQIY